MNVTASLINRDAVAVWHPFTQHGLGRNPIPIAGGLGAVLRDAEGHEYLDMISSWWVNLFGHGRPELARAVFDQILQLDHVQFAGATHEPAVALAERLLEKAELTGNAKVFYSDNGSTAVEAALKISHQHWRNHGETRPLFACLRGGYHGDTVGAMSVGRDAGFFKAFDGMLFESVSLPVPLIWNGHENKQGEQESLALISSTLDSDANKISALIVEPLVQGAGGMRFHSPDYMRRTCELFRQRGIPVIFDEVMTGFGRTGSFFAYQQIGFIPDLICLSKGITGGILPLAATIASNNLFESFLGNDFSLALAHGHSYTANPAACAAALASLDLHTTMNSLGQVRRLNDRFRYHLELLSKSPLIEHCRMVGGIAAFDLRSTDASYSAGAGRHLSDYAQKEGILLRPLGNVIYLMPPYCTSDAQIDRAFEVIGDFLAITPPAK